MGVYLGIDTSNYTTSCSLFSNNFDNIKNMIQEKKLLPVKNGEAGLRQSEAVFHHTKQLGIVFEKLFSKAEYNKLNGIGVTIKPRNQEDSYMPCFICGENTADIIGTVMNIPVFKTSHQVNHILAALYSANKLCLLNNKFIAFHVSGGTTDCLLCSPDNKDIITINQIGTSMDLKAGQAIDRIGLAMGLQFPCGRELEKLSENSNKTFKTKPIVRNGNCCISGLENKCKHMLNTDFSKEDVAKFCLSYIENTISEMVSYAISLHGNLPIIFAGGVMSNKWISTNLKNKYEAFFAEPVYSCDNACGAAIYAALKSGEKLF